MDYTKLTNAELATLAVANLGGATRALDIEDIAIELYRIAKERFSWRKYPENIDIQVVRVSLSDAQRSDPPLLAGGIKNGYMLSPNGLEWIDTLSKVETESESQLRRSRAGSFHQSIDLERIRLRKTRAFFLIKSGNLAEVTISNLNEFLRINEYFPEKKILSRIRIIENAVQDDKELLSVWNKLKSQFEQELQGYVTK